MNFCEAINVFLAAASITIARIQADRARVPKRCHRALEYLEKRVFDPRLNVELLFRDCEIRDRSFSAYFRHEIGLAPARYIKTCRIEVAEKIVRETSIDLQWIRGLVGYSSLKVFSNAFKRQTEYPPRAYRKRCKAPATKIIERVRSAELERITELKKALSGRLDLADVDRMIRKLFKLYPDLGAQNERSSNRAVGRSFYV